MCVNSRRGNIGGRPAMEDLVRRSLSVNIGKLEAAGEALLQTAQTAAKTKRAKRRPGLLASKDCHRAALTLKAQCCEGQGTAQRRLTFKEDGTCELIPGEGPCQARHVWTWFCPHRILGSNLVLCVQRLLIM